VPYPLLFPLILLFCLIGAYSIANSPSNIFMMLGMGLVGYWMRKTRYEAAPLVVALVLGTPFEAALRQSLILSGGSFAIFFTRPIALVLMAAALALLALAVVGGTRARMQARGFVDAGT
jgi:putative tricarboxylic transport membrane protein